MEDRRSKTEDGRSKTARWLLVILLLGGCFRSDPAPYTPRDPRLAAFPLYFYPTTDSTKPARAFVFFLGNDIGFWGAHQDLAN